MKSFGFLRNWLDWSLWDADWVPLGSCARLVCKLFMKPFIHIDTIKTLHCNTLPYLPPSLRQFMVKEPEWPNEHLDIYRSAGLSWPPEIVGEFGKRVAHMPRRKQECAFYFQQVNAELKDNDKDTYHDLNTNLYLKSGSVNHVLPIICSSSIWSCRLQRELHGSELLALQGFPDDMIAATDLTHERYTELAGTAFNGFQFAAIVTAILMSMPFVQVSSDATPAQIVVLRGFIHLHTPLFSCSNLFLDARISVTCTILNAAPLCGEAYHFHFQCCSCALSMKLQTCVQFFCETCIWVSLSNDVPGQSAYYVCHIGAVFSGLNVRLLLWMRTTQ